MDQYGDRGPSIDQSSDDYKKRLAQHLQSTGVVGAVKVGSQAVQKLCHFQIRASDHEKRTPPPCPPRLQSQLRANLLSQLQRGQLVQLGPPPGDKPTLKRHALNSMIADYFTAVQYNYSMSVFKEESGIDARPVLTEDEVLDALKIDRDTAYYQAYMKARAYGAHAQRSHQAMWCSDACKRHTGATSVRAFTHAGGSPLSD